MIGPVPDGMDGYVPRHRHILLDATRHSPCSGTNRDNLVDTLFCLEACRSPLDLFRELGHLNQLLAKPGRRELRRSFAAWLHQAYLPSRLGKRFPKIREADIEEVRKMIELREDAWCLQWKKEGKKEGKREGLRSLLLRQLGCKFGRIDKGCKQKIEAASEERLLDWGERLLAAGTLEQVFGE